MPVNIIPKSDKINWSIVRWAVFLATLVFASGGIRQQIKDNEKTCTVDVPEMQISIATLEAELTHFDGMAADIAQLQKDMAGALAILKFYDPTAVAEPQRLEPIHNVVAFFEAQESTYDKVKEKGW